MTRETETVWKSESGRELLRHKHGETFYIPLSEIDPAIMRELRDALADALADPLVSAVNEANRRAKQ